MLRDNYPANISGPYKIHVINLLAIFSGCCSLAYEVLYVRALTSILGDMFYVHAALLSTFLLGIGLGSKLARRFLKWLWLFEILTGVYAFSLPFIIRQIAQNQFLVTITSNSWLTIGMTIIFIAIPSLLIGFSIPLFSAYRKALTPERLSFQTIYKIYNFGAFVSILAVELLLIRQLGISKSIYIIGIFNVINGVILLIIKGTPDQADIQHKPVSFPVRCILALAMASFCSAVFQMFFLKLSYLVFHPHRENFAIGLAITMLGLALGSWLVEKSKIRFESLLILLVLSIGIIYLAYLPILKVFEATVPLARKSAVLILLHKFIFGSVFALAPMTFFGGLIPALMRSEKQVAGESGYLLWISCLANAVGYVIYAVAVHPYFSNGIALALIGVTLLMAALLPIPFIWRKFHWATASLGLALVIILGFTWQDRYFYLAHWVNVLKPSDNVYIFKSGAESATLVNSQRSFKEKIDRSEFDSKQEDSDIWQDLWISYNGHPSITVQRNGVVNFAEMVVGTIPAITAPTLEKAMVIGVGTGVTAGTTSRLFETTDVVEINDAFYKMMPALQMENLDLEHNPKAIKHLADGRAFLVGRDGMYDAILNTVSAPTYFSASKIYTVDFYQRVSKALKPNGVFSTWISAADMSREGMMTILSALRKSFAYCEIRFLRGNYYLLTCSNEPVKNQRKFSDLPQYHPLTDNLKRSLIFQDLDEYFVDIRLSENVFDHFEPKVAKENTDDHPVLEFMVVRDYQLGTMGLDPFLEGQALLNIRPFEQEELQNPARFARKAALYWHLGSDFYEFSFQPILMKNAAIAPEFFVLAARHDIHEKKYDKAIALLSTAVKIRPDFAEAYNLIGTVSENSGRIDDAINNYNQAVKLKPDFLEARRNLAAAISSKGFDMDAEKMLNQSLAIAKEDESNMIANTHFSLGKVLKKLDKSKEAEGHFEVAIAMYQKQLEQLPGSTQIRVNLGESLAEIGKPEQAVGYYEQALAINPMDEKVHVKLITALKLSGSVEKAVETANTSIAFFERFNKKKDVELLKNLAEQLQSQ